MGTVPCIACVGLRRVVVCSFAGRAGALVSASDASGAVVVALAAFHQPVVWVVALDLAVVSARAGSHDSEFVENLVQKGLIAFAAIRGKRARTHVALRVALGAPVRRALVVADCRAARNALVVVVDVDRRLAGDAHVI